MVAAAAAAAAAAGAVDCSGFGSCGGAEMGFGYGGEGIGVQFRRLVGEFWGKEMDSQRHFQRS